MRRFLRQELDRYLAGRGTEQKDEQPLLRADGAAYVHYQKGALALYHTVPHGYTDEHRRLVSRVSGQIAAVINNAIDFEQTREDSVTDPLTGLPNTRFLYAHAGRELARAARLKSLVALMLLDLENLKPINDTFGHQAGNRALCAVESVLRGAIRPYDICVRYGGDEFRQTFSLPIIHADVRIKL